ncbi:non-ribosomal peptide synthetase [Micromonospora mirobrigensis]|uniref:Amino acid adenylation domain-containing protein n=1 Tax=Micromonospora mirobrigensis TaxID=262898 RepID=A0A1C4YWF4_9ACTN|nr:non-ribosomal peptide synthetase [Micromonospora mirobrigensis]SCF24976.1 amino acid adenylation domain-containing protein [Micromonospora mirobrigensis]
MESGPGTLAHQLVARWARERPDAVAVSSERRSLTYAQLDTRADRLAGALRAHGVGPETRVGICLPRTADWITALLAVFKAGGAYVPLDPEYPAARLEYMLTDSAATVLVGAGPTADHLARACDVPLLAPAAGADATATGPGPHPDNLAYVIYTSGSTGRPKGVQVTHASLGNMLAGLAPALEVGPGRRTLQCVSFSFDISVFDTLATLTNGGTLVIATKEEVASPERLADRLRGERIHTVALPPSVLATLVDQEFPDLAVVGSGGEACPPKLAASFAARHRFVNGYGPTETTVAASLFEVTPAHGELPSVPIGAPCAGVSLYVVDDPAGTASPPGGTGEICIGGAGVARGYLGRPALTAAAFVPDPFSDVPGSRLYRTGDLGRFLPDGALEFSGRADGQVKIRGHRIELNEIRQALERHPRVSQAAVLVGETGLLGGQILAFVLPAPGPGPVTGGLLRRHLADELPDYMIPNSIALLREFPLTPNHKVDHAALLARGAGPRRRDAPVVAPRTPVEADLLRIWQEVLGQPEIGVRDDFFELGGHSLLAAQVVARIEKAHGVQLRLETLLAQGRTVEGLAEAVSRAAAGGGTGRPPITRIPRPARRTVPS